MRIRMEEDTERGTCVCVLNDVGTYDLAELIRPRVSLIDPPVSSLWWTPCDEGRWSALVLESVEFWKRQVYDSITIRGMVIFPLTRSVDYGTYARLAKRVGDVHLDGQPVRYQIEQYNPSQTSRREVPHVVCSGRHLDPWEVLS